MTSPLVSILIPVWNEAGTIDDVLWDLVSQTFQDFEVLVVDGGSTDDTVARSECFYERLDLQVIQHGRPSTPEQLNVGLAKAQGRWVARVDGHVRLPEDYLETIHRHLAEGFAAVGTRKTAVGRTGFGRALARSLNSSSSTGGSAYHHATDCLLVDHVPYAAYDGDLIRQLDGWDERFLTNQDVELDRRVAAAGGLLLLDGTITTLWASKNTPRAAWRQFRRYGRGRAMTARVHPRSVEARHAVLAGFTVVDLIAAAAVVARSRLSVLALVHPLVNLALAARDHTRSRGGATRDHTRSRGGAPRAGSSPAAPPAESAVASAGLPAGLAAAPPESPRAPAGLTAELRATAPPAESVVASVGLTAAAMCLTQLAWGTGYLQALADPRLLSEDHHRRRLDRRSARTYG